MSDETCSLSQRTDKPWHSWRFDGDDPRVICTFCGEMRDAINGRVMRPGRSLIEEGKNDGVSRSD